MEEDLGVVRMGVGVFGEGEEEGKGWLRGCWQLERMRSRERGGERLLAQMGRVSGRFWWVSVPL